MRPKISIITPSYNQGRFIRETIESVLSQDYPDLELILVDGGSTDESVRIVKEYESKITWWVSEKDKGQSDAIDKGVKHATGELIGWINSDDVLLPNALNRIAAAYAKQPDAGVFGGNFVIINAAGESIRCKRMPQEAVWFAHHGVFAVAQPGSFFRRDLYQRVQGLNMDLHYNMDTDLYMRMLISGVSYAYTPHYLAGFRVHVDAKTTAHKDLTLAEMKMLAEKLWPEPMASNFTRRRWRHLHNAWQFLNGNYLRMYMETVQNKGKYWKSLSL